MKKRLLFLLLALVLTAGALLPAFATEAHDPAVAAAEAAVANAVGVDTPGAAVVVLRGGTVVLAEGFGYADLDERRPVTTDTVFEIGELSTGFVAVAALQLSAAGSLNLDRDIAAYLPVDFMAELNLTYPVSTRHLLSGRAGFGGRNFDTWFRSDAYRFESLEEALLSDVPVQTVAPGTCYIASPYGVTLAAYVIECVTGMDYVSYATEHILTPLGMTHTVLNPTVDDATERDAVGYKSVGGGQFDGERKWRRYAGLYPAAGARSSAADLSLWLEFLLYGGRDDILPDAYREQLFVGLKNGVFTPATPGLEKQGACYISRGQTGFFAASVAFDLAAGQGALVLTNVSESELTGFPAALCGAAVTVDELPEGDLIELKKFRGVYNDATGEVRTFVGRIDVMHNVTECTAEKDGFLHFGERRYRQIAPGVFADADADDGTAVLQFLLDENGKVVAAVTAEGQTYVPLPFYYAKGMINALFGAMVTLSGMFLLMGIYGVYRWYTRRRRRRSELEEEEEESFRYVLPGILAAVLALFVFIEMLIAFRVGASALSTVFFALSVLALLLGTCATVAYIVAFVTSILDRKTHRRLALNAILFVLYALLVYFWGLCYFGR